jgi:hypothetical protein
MRKQLVITAMVVAAFAAVSRVAEASDEIVPASDPRVRSGHERIVALIARATAQSATFRRMVETIEASDGIVYIQEGVCRGGIRACLIGVTKPGAMRLLWIRVDTLKTDYELMASIGHELQHAIEVLRNRTVTSTGAMFLLYVREGSKGASGAFETVAAVATGEAVALELAPR